ncbi:MAG: hypothetical protein P8175_20055 [Deltaproteobacteria bacterium]
MTREERVTHWQRRVQEQAQSGMSAAAFCKDHQINLQRFYSWRRRFMVQSDAQTTGGFLELVPSSKVHGSGIRIRLDERLSIELDRGFDPSSLRNAIDVLCGKASCWR